MRLLIVRARRLIREPFWVLLLAALAAGLAAGVAVAGESRSDLATAVVGHAWRGDAKATRELLTKLFGLQLTVLTIVLSLNAPMIQSSANQYSPRLVPFYLKNVPLRSAIPVFVFSGAYIVAAVREVGLAADEAAVRPRIVVSGAMVLLVLAFVLLTTTLIRTFRFMRVERVLGLVRRSTFAALARLQARARRLALSPSATLSLPADASPLPSPSSGYLVQIDLASLAAWARRARARVRICRCLGDYVDRGEVIGWIAPDSAGPLPASLPRRLARALVLAPTREADFDVTYGILILADVAARALSSSANDSYTARQALQQLRSVLRRLARMPLGDLNVIDEDGAVRASVMAPQLRELVSAAVEAPLRHGAGHPEVLDGVLEIALEVGLAAHDAEGRAVAHQLVDRVLDDSTRYGGLQDGRRERLLAEVAVVRAALGRDDPRPERHARANWALTNGAGATPAAGG